MAARRGLQAVGGLGRPVGGLGQLLFGLRPQLARQRGGLRGGGSSGPRVAGKQPFDRLAGGDVAQAAGGVHALGSSPGRDTPI